MSVKVIGLDIAKHVFQVHGGNATGKTPEEAVQRSQPEIFSQSNQHRRAITRSDLNLLGPAARESRRHRR